MDIIELYYLLKNNFDIVVYIIQKELDIKCSLNFWNKVLQQYLINQAYCFPYLTEVNLPYVFAYRGMTHNSLYGQQVRVNSEIFFALQKHRYVKFNTPKVQDKEYRIIASQNNFLNLEFRFTEYTQHAVDGNELVESMEFCVDDLSDGKTVFCKTIEFSETYFMNIVNHTNKDYRNQKLLDIAKTTMLPLNK